MDQIRPRPFTSFGIRTYVRTYGSKTVRRVEYTNDGYDTIDLIYEPAIDKLSVRWNWFHPDISSRASCHSAFLSPNIVYHWNRKHNCLEIIDDYNQTRNRHPHRFDIREVKTSIGFRKPLGRVESMLHDYRPTLEAFGDREVFGLASDDGVQIWFFNPHFVPDVPGAKPFIPMEGDLSK